MRQVVSSMSLKNNNKKNPKLTALSLLLYLYIIYFSYRMHWVCAILVPETYHVYYLDPVNAPITNYPVILKTIKEAYGTD
ncbi:hypothetical protein CsatB_027145 [Cannabis sativa]